MAFGIQERGGAVLGVLSVVISPKGGGTTVPAAGTSTYNPGASVTVTFTASTGYQLDHWEVDGVSKGSASSVTVTMGTAAAAANHLVVAVVVIAASGGLVSGPGATNIGFGASTVTSTVSASAGDVAVTVSPSTSDTAGNPNVSQTVQVTSTLTAGNPNVSQTVKVTSSFTTAGSGAALPWEWSWETG